jgi:hypothetical protein
MLASAKKSAKLEPIKLNSDMRLTSGQGRGRKGPRRPHENGKAVMSRECPRSARSGQGRMHRCDRAVILGPVPGPDVLDSTLAPVELAPVWVMSSDRAVSHAKRRCEDRRREPRKPAARARSDVGGRSSRGEIMLERRSRGEPLHEHEPEGRGDPLRKKSRDRRRGSDIGAGSGGASRYAAKSMMLNRISARNSRPESVQSTGNAANPARRGERRGRRGCGQEGLHQKRIKCEHAERGAAYHRTLAETPILKARNQCPYRGLIQRNTVK